MKANASILVMIGFFLCLWGVNAASLSAQEATAGGITITGTIKDRNSRKELENMNISLVGTHIGTVSNADGTFSLKIPMNLIGGGMEVSGIGYLSTRFSAEVLQKQSEPLTVWMVPAANMLGEVVVYGGNARRIVAGALQKIGHNYADEDNMLEVFYRETIQKRHRYIGISEAMMNVYKTDYKMRDINRDKVQLTKARRLLSQKQSDTLAVKVAGGPTMSLFLDFVKNSNALFDEETLDYYAFQQEQSVMLDERMQLVISFRPQVRLPYALFVGRVYIDCERLSFTRAEFSLDVSDRTKAAQSVLQKKPAGLRFRLQEVSFLISYKQQNNGKSYLNYIRNGIRFKCDWKRRFFSSTYTATSEMVVVDREERPAEVFRLRNSFRPRQLFYDEVEEYWNEDFWKEYNIIEPTESLENAVRKLKKKSR